MRSRFDSDWRCINPSKYGYYSVLPDDGLLQPKHAVAKLYVYNKLSEMWPMVFYTITVVTLIGHFYVSLFLFIPKQSTIIYKLAPKNTIYHHKKKENSVHLAMNITISKQIQKYSRAMTMWLL